MSILQILKEELMNLEKNTRQYSQNGYYKSIVGCSYQSRINTNGACRGDGQYLED